MFDGLLFPRLTLILDNQLPTTSHSDTTLPASPCCIGSIRIVHHQAMRRRLVVCRGVTGQVKCSRLTAPATDLYCLQQSEKCDGTIPMYNDVVISSVNHSPFPAAAGSNDEGKYANL